MRNWRKSCMEKLELRNFGDRRKLYTSNFIVVRFYTLFLQTRADMRRYGVHHDDLGERGIQCHFERRSRRSGRRSVVMVIHSTRVSLSLQAPFTLSADPFTCALHRLQSASVYTSKKRIPQTLFSEGEGSHCRSAHFRLHLVLRSQPLATQRRHHLSAQTTCRYSQRKLNFSSITLRNLYTPITRHPNLRRDMATVKGRMPTAYLGGLRFQACICGRLRIRSR
jgi:hypothetical protein